MKSITRIFATLCVLASAAACQQYEIDTQMTPEKEYANLRLVCDALTTYTVAASRPDDISFNVSANSPWTVTRSAGADWCTVTPSSSSSSSLISDVVVSFADNDSGEDRTATLTIQAERISKYYTVVITQGRKGRLYVTPFAQDFSAAGGPLTFTINTNQPWEIRTDVSWLSFDRENGQPDPDGKTITIHATAEPSAVLERVATVTVVAGDEEESFDVSQRGSFSMTEISGEFPSAGGSQALKLRTDLPWTVVADKDWLSFDKESGEGGGTSVVTVTAAPNTDVVRRANITVTAGGEDHTFEVVQAGESFSIVPPASTEIAPQGGELIIEVDSSKDWTPVSDVEEWTVEKIDDAHFKVTVPFNGKFVPATGKVAITSGSARDEIELTQDINFTFTGHTEILEDGSVKVYEDVVSGIVSKDNYRYVIMDADVEMHLGDMGSFTMCTEHYGDGYEYELQFNLTRSDAFRLRSNGEKVTSKGAKEFTFDKAKANAMTHGQIRFVPDPDTAGMINQSFYWNGEKQDKVLVSTSVFAADPAIAGTYSVASIKAVDDGSYFIIKSCIITPVE